MTSSVLSAQGVTQLPCQRFSGAALSLHLPDYATLLLCDSFETTLSKDYLCDLVKFISSAICM